MISESPILALIEMRAVRARKRPPRPGWWGWLENLCVLLLLPLYSASVGLWASAGPYRAAVGQRLAGVLIATLACVCLAVLSGGSLLLESVLILVSVSLLCKRSVEEQLAQ